MRERLSGMRMRALLAKEFADLRQNRGVLIPVVIMAVVALAVPFIVVLLVPRLSGHRISDDADMIKLATAISRRSPFHDLGSEATVQAFLFQQFLLFLTLIPATGAMTLASHSVIGEKQNRTLEPLLATPIATVELLTAKVLGALAPTLAVTVVAFGAYVGGIWWLAAPGVLRVLLSRRTMLIVFLLGPLAAMVALQIAVVVSSRVNDPRTAQQFGTLVILPLIGIMVAQFSGAFWLTTPLIVAVALVLFSVWLLLMVAGVVLFERENILTRWK